MTYKGIDYQGNRVKERTGNLICFLYRSTEVWTRITRTLVGCTISEEFNWHLRSPPRSSVAPKPSPKVVHPIALSSVTCVVAKSRKVVHNGGHKTNAGPLTKPYFIGFLGFPESATENPSLSATLKWLQESPIK